MSRELKERLVKLCEARRMYDNARAHLSSVVERGEFGAVRDSQVAERDALVALLTAVTMTCVAAGESIAPEEASSAVHVAKQLQENHREALGSLVEALSLVQALAARLTARADACPCVTGCAECRADEELLAKAGG